MMNSMKPSRTKRSTNKLYLLLDQLKGIEYALDNSTLNDIESLCNKLEKTIDRKTLKWVSFRILWKT